MTVLGVGIASWQIAGINRDARKANTAKRVMELAVGLKKRGHRVSVFIPYHDLSGTEGISPPVRVLEDISVCLAGKAQRGEVFYTQIHDPETEVGVPIFLLGHAGGYDQWGGVEPWIYASRMLPRAYSRLVERGEIGPLDVLHLNDVELALAAAVIRNKYKNGPEFENTVLVGTIHNGKRGFQGEVEAGRECFPLTGLPWDEWHHANGLEAYKRLVLMKGMGYCDWNNIVGKYQAQLLRTPSFGGLLRGWYEYQIETGKFRVVSERKATAEFYEKVYIEALRAMRTIKSKSGPPTKIH